MAWMAGVLSLTAAVYFGTQLVAKPAPPAAPAQTRVAVLNLRRVIKNYDRYQQFIEEMKKQEQGYVDAIKAKQTQIEALTKQAELLQGPARDAKEKEMRTVQQEIENIKLDARKEMAAKGNDEMVKVFIAVRDAASRYAKANNFDLVLHFEGAGDEKEVDTSALVTKQINAGCSPLYWNSSLDISGPVLDAVNAAHKRGDK